jgi:hypothetical protein
MLTRDAYASARREQLQREHGICSDPNCDEPIWGWCDTCHQSGTVWAPKLCDVHLLAHLAAHPDHWPYWPWDKTVPATGRGGAA